MEHRQSCKYCGSGRTIRKGFRKTKTLGRRQVWMCKACGRKFTPEDQGAGQIPEGDPPTPEDDAGDGIRLIFGSGDAQ